MESLEQGSVTKFDLDYAAVLAEILRKEPVLNARTGRKVKAVHGVHFRTHEAYLPILTLRDIKPLWSCAESVWFVGGGSHVNFMRSFGFKSWDAFADPRGAVASATGFRWRQAFGGVDQLSEVMAKLSKDPTTRQAVMLSWVPPWDLVQPGPNAPCVIAWHFEVLEDKLHMSVMQRSADMFFGFPHDILGFSIVQELMADGLHLQPGVISYHVSNAHLYEDQWWPALKMLARASSARLEDVNYRLPLRDTDWGRALMMDEALPRELHAMILQTYKPWPAIVGPRLVV